MRLSPVLAEMATYPFVRLEEAKRAARARGLELIDFGVGDPREATDQMIRQALVDAVEERLGYPLAVGLPELRAAIAAWIERRFGVVVDSDSDVLPTLGSKEAIFSFAQLGGDRGAAQVSTHGRYGPARVRPAGLDRRVGRRGARGANARHLPTKAGGDRAGVARARHRAGGKHGDLLLVD